MASVVADTSPLQYLHQLGCLQLLHEQFAEVIVPATVCSELELGLALGANVPDLSQHPWLNKKRASGQLVFERGEDEVIALAKDSNSLAMLDDLRARRAAMEAGVRCIGTLGVLLAAKRNGQLSSLRPYLDMLRDSNFRLSDSLAEALLAHAGE